MSQHIDECFRLQRALDSSDNEAIHEFRLACKRLRYAIEHFELAELAADAKVLAALTDELGFGHDCVLLGKIAVKAGAPAVNWRAQQDRSQYLKRGRALWQKVAKSLVVAACFFFLVVSQAHAAARPTLAAALSAITGNYPHTQFGIAVYDLDKHKIIYGWNEQRFFLAASTTKLLTEGTTLALLGPDYRFTTNVYRTGPIDTNGTLNGDVVLQASGDPNLSGRIQPDGTMTFENEDHSYDGSPDTKAVPGNPLAVIDELAQQIAAHGVKTVTGRVIVDESLFEGGYPESGTGVFVSPIVVNDNIVDVTATPGARAGDPVTIAVSPQTPYVTFINKAITGAVHTDRTISIPADQADAGGMHTVTITGSMPAGSPSILYAYDVPSPVRFAEVALTAALQARGVAVQNASTASAPLAVSEIGPNVIAAHVSPPLSQDVKVTLKVSDNLHASIMPYLWSPKHTLRAGFDLERGFMRRAGLDTSQIVQNDGLGGFAFIQPQYMVHYLAFLRTQPYFPTLYAALPILGVDGTLFNIANSSPARGKVHAKTGTWSGGDALNHRVMVSGKGLAGYMTTASGRHIAFCFYINNLAVPHGEDAARVSGQINGDLATATYLYAR
ncbi:MAG TPA: D-alanyl-D-alanine carboxypeptidase/D-alanyl-D-alanine-endopeptidase [Candidatus Rubrimentiphilum sp.]|nr:D-alanyl-D-alanine carboxypeptidase/D-alanyl-D-alanine-endopeptidase [Candidatus Rubrimentiphilum sp.]